jgi:probable rRNA maturation factor
MKLRMNIDSEEDPPSPFPSGAAEKLESVLEEEAPLLCPRLGDYAEAEVSVSFLDPAEMRDVNKQHRGLDEPTDVLTFPLWEEGEPFAPPVPFGPLPLGDILICVEETEREFIQMPRLEALCLVLAHGFLHLLGFDHDTPEKEKIMWDRQEFLKSRLLDAVERGPLT